MRSKARLKAGIYFSHYECFGHTSRVLAVGEAFPKRFPQRSLFFIQAGVSQPQTRLDQRGRVYSLPGAFMGRRSFRKPISGAGMNTSARSKACVDIVSREKPDFFITEFFPLGREECRHELIPALIKASAQGAVLLGVAGYPLLTGTDYEWREKILKLYRRIIIFAPVVEKDFIAESLSKTAARQKYLEFFEKNSGKIQFAGYLLPQQGVVCNEEDKNLPKPPVPKGVCRVAVVRGGGAYYPKLIAEAVRASDLIGKEYYFTVVAGPATTPQEGDFFAALVRKKKINNLVLLRAVGDYEGLISKSDICVSVASYHSSVLLLKYRKKAVVIPFEGYGGWQSFHEQPARAALLKEKIGTRILSIQDLTAVSLTEAIKDTAGQPQGVESIPEEWFKGADVFQEALTELLPRYVDRKTDPGPGLSRSRVRP